MAIAEDETRLDFNSLWKGLGRIMDKKEDETHLIRVVFDVRNINILIKFWHEVKTQALNMNRLDEASMAASYIKAFQEARAAHGIAPLVLAEEKEPSKVMTASTNGLPDEGDA